MFLLKYPKTLFARLNLNEVSGSQLDHLQTLHFFVHLWNSLHPSFMKRFQALSFSILHLDSWLAIDINSDNKIYHLLLKE